MAGKSRIAGDVRESKVEQLNRRRVPEVKVLARSLPRSGNRLTFAIAGAAALAWNYNPWLSLALTVLAIGESVGG